MLEHMSMAFAAEGVITLAGSRIYTSMADTDEGVRTLTPGQLAPYLHDADGNRYIDFLQAGGPTVLGSNPPVGDRDAFVIILGAEPDTACVRKV